MVKPVSRHAIYLRNFYMHASANIYEWYALYTAKDWAHRIKFQCSKVRLTIGCGNEMKSWLSVRHGRLTVAPERSTCYLNVSGMILLI